MKAIIIGAGVSGLSTGTYLRMNHIDTTIFEKNNLPGGVCTSWKRGDYTFDHCLHWVIGTNKLSPLYTLLEELGIVPGTDFYHTRKYKKIIMNDIEFTAYTEIDLLESEMLSKFPKSEYQIKRYISLIRFFKKFRPPIELNLKKMRVQDFFRILPYIPRISKLMKQSINDYLKKSFSDETLREIISRLFPVQGLPALMAVLPLAYMSIHEGGYPLGGSFNFTKKIESRFLNKGGKIEYNKRVKKIIIENKKAIGVELVDGEKHFADMIISASDGRDVLFNMIGGEYTLTTYRKLYKSPPLWPSILSVSLGVNMDLSDEVEMIEYRLDNPVSIANREMEWIGFSHQCYDNSIAPGIKSVVKFQIETDYSYWENLHEQEDDQYRDEKEKVLKFCISELEKRFPGITNRIEETDVATPFTWEKNTGNWQGSYQGWLPTAKIMNKRFPRKLKDLSCFFMTGQWTFSGGGVTMCMAQSRRTAAAVCKEMGLKFITEK